MPIPKRQVTFRHRLGNPNLGAPEEFWIEADIDSEWTVAYKVLQHSGYPVIGELRIFPSEKSIDTPRPAGRWSGLVANVPAGGITTRLLRLVKLGSDVAVGLKVGNKYVQLMPEAVPRFRQAGFRRLKKAPRKGHGWSDAVLLDAARFYVERGGHRPVADLAEAWKLAGGASQARDILQAAKEKGFLTAGTRGKTSRALTEKAKALLTQKESER